MPFKVYLLFVLLLIFPLSGFSQTTSTIEERLIRLEEGQKALNQRIDDVNNRIDDLNLRIDDLRSDMNNRFEDMNRKFNWLYILLGAIIALNGAMVGSVIWLARQERPIGQKQYDELLDREFQLQKEIREIKLRLDRLESTGLAGK